MLSGRTPANEIGTPPPVIQINGDNPAIIQVGATYTDLGATIEGPQADLNLGIATYVNGTQMNPVQIDTTQAATDTIDYVATDQNGLTATSTRTVIIEAPTLRPAQTPLRPPPIPAQTTQPQRPPRPTPPQPQRPMPPPQLNRAPPRSLHSPNP